MNLTSKDRSSEFVAEKFTKLHLLLEKTVLYPAEGFGYEGNFFDFVFEEGLKVIYWSTGETGFLQGLKFGAENGVEIGEMNENMEKMDLAGEIVGMKVVYGEEEGIKLINIEICIQEGGEVKWVRIGEKEEEENFKRIIRLEEVKFDGGEIVGVNGKVGVGIGTIIFQVREKVSIQEGKSK